MFCFDHSVTALLLAVILAGCGDEGTTAVDDPGMVGPDGGTFAFANGNVVVQVPAGAVSENVTLTVAQTSAHPASSRFVANSAYDIGPDGLQFAVPVTVTIGYGGAGLPAGVLGAELRIFKVVNNTWEQVAGGSADTDTNTVTAQISSLSVYGLLGVPPASVTVSPSEVSVTVDNTAQLTAEVRDADDDILSDRAVIWSSDDEEIATVDATGLVTGVASGEATITAQAEDVNGTAAVEVAEEGGAAPVLVEDFSTYSSTADLLSDPRGIYQVSEDVNSDQIELDQSEGYGGLSQSMKYTYPDRTSHSSRCSDYILGRRVNLSNKSEIWFEIWLKFSDDFTTDAPGSWGCSSNPDLKLVLNSVSGGGSRFNFTIGTGSVGWAFGYPGNEAALEIWGEPDARDYFNDQWFRLRFHYKVSSASGVADGRATWWLDDTMMKDFTNLMINRTGILNIILGANMNQGPGHDIFLWWGRITVWTGDPGW